MGRICSRPTQTAPSGVRASDVAETGASASMPRSATTPRSLRVGYVVPSRPRCASKGSSRSSATRSRSSQRPPSCPSTTVRMTERDPSASAPSGDHAEPSHPEIRLPSCTTTVPSLRTMRSAMFLWIRIDLRVERPPLPDGEDAAVLRRHPDRALGPHRDVPDTRERMVRVIADGALDPWPDDLGLEAIRSAWNPDRAGVRGNRGVTRACYRWCRQRADGEYADEDSPIESRHGDLPSPCVACRAAARTL